MEVEEDGGPRGRLVLRHTRNDGNVNLRITDDQQSGRGRRDVDTEMVECVYLNCHKLKTEMPQA